MTPYERHNLYKPYPKLSPFDIYPKATIVLSIIIGIAFVLLFIRAVGMPGAY
jgi:hypothetical protein